MPSFGEIVERSLALLNRRGRVSHTALRLEFGLDDATFAALREELVGVLGAADDDGRVLVARAGATAAGDAPDHHHDPAASAGAGAEPFGDVPQAAGAIQRQGAPPLVGRMGERALLQALAARAAGGIRSAVLVRGEAGIGKTRLLEQLGAGAGEDLGMTVMHCACSPYHRGSALHPLLAGLRRHWALDGSDASGRLAARAATLSGGERAAALLADMLGVAAPEGAEPAPALGPARRRRESLAALADALTSESRRAPLLLVVDDVHWADASTLELVATLLDGPRELALMIALTARSEFVGLPQRTLQRIELGRLDAQESLRLVEHVAAAGALPDGVAGELAQQAGGSPLLATELTRTALALQAHGPPAPTTLYGCLMARLDRDPAARDVAQLAATIGREFDRTLLDAVGTIDAAALDWGLERLVAEGVVVPAAPGRFAFSHSLVQDAARSSQRKRALRSHNLQIAGALLEQFPHVAVTEPERVARHLEYAGELREAVRHWQQAGRQALGRHALREATLLLERALELNARTPDGPARRGAELELRLLAGDAMAAHAGRNAPAAVAHHARAERLSADVEASAERCDGLLRLTAYRILDGRPADALTLALDLLAVAEAADADPALLPEAECDVGGALVACGRHRDSLGHLARAVELCAGDRRTDNRERFGRDPAAAALAHRALALACRDDHEGARYAIDSATMLLAEHPHPCSAAAVHCAAATAAHIRGDHVETLSAAAAAIALATAEDLRELLARARALHGWARVRAGAHEDGLGELRRAAAAWTTTGAAAGGPFVYGLLGDALARTGEPEHAIAALDEGLRWVAGGERWYEPELHRMRAELLLGIGDPAGAHRSAGAAVSLARRMRAGAWERRAAATLARQGSAAPVA